MNTGSKCLMAAGFLPIAQAHSSYAAEPTPKSILIFIAGLHHQGTPKRTPYCPIGRDETRKGSWSRRGIGEFSVAALQMLPGEVVVRWVQDVSRSDRNTRLR